MIMIYILEKEIYIKRFICLALALLMMAMMLVACGNETPEQPDQPETPDVPSTPTEPETPADTRIPLDMPERYYGRTNGDKESFHMLEWTANNWFEAGNVWLPWHEGDTSEEAEDLLGAAVFARNAYVEEQYGVEITQEYVEVNDGKHLSRLRLDNTTSGNEIQLVTMRSLEAWSYVESGLLYDMNTYAGEILHTDQPWWVQDAVESYTLGDSLYLCSTEMLLRDKGATALMFFNPTLAADYGLGNLYDLMDNGDWTFEAMISASDVVASDRDGDDLINTRQDIWGITGADDTIFYLFAGADKKFAHIDEEGYLAYDFGNKDTILVMEEIFEEVMYAEWYQNGYVNPLPGEGGMFGDGLALFDFALLKAADIGMRDVEFDYGVLPIPKYDDDQDDYRSLVWVHHDCVLGIPSATFDPEMASVILEALSYESYYTLTPVLYDTLLYGRLSKTEDARRGYETVVANRVYDPGQYWEGKAGLTNKILRHTATHTTGFSNIWGSYQTPITTQVELINDFIDETR